MSTEAEKTIEDLQGSIEGRDMTLCTQRAEIEDWKRRAFEGLKILDELTPHVRSLAEGPISDRVAALRNDFPVPF